MADGTEHALRTGLFVMGQNPAVGAPNARLERRALANLKWLVVRDMVETETATFWLDSPEVQRGELRTERDRHRGVLLSRRRARGEGTAASPTRSGCCSGTRRRSIRPATPQRGLVRLSSRPATEGARRRAIRAAQRGLNALTWDYPTAGPHDEPEIEAVLQEINGRWTSRRRAGRGLHASWRPTAPPRAAAGSTPASIRQPAATAPRERDASGPYGHGWGFAWPADRRILYNRASARPDGTPWSERKKLVWWDRGATHGPGSTRRTSRTTKPPDYVPPPDAGGDAAIPRRCAVHHARRRARLDLGAERPQGRTAAGALRAARVAGREPSVSPAGRIRPPIAKSGPTIRTRDRPAIRGIRTCSRPTG